jgi:iron complex outermembrane receptor protein
MPGLRASLDLGMPVAMGVRAAGAMRVTGSQYCQHPELGQMVQLGTQGAGDLALTRQWAVGGSRWGNLRAFLAVDNVSDAAVYDQCGLPQPGRTVRVGVELR